ncbi:hypothetical protein PS2_022468 [Malus domestica]
MAENYFGRLSAHEVAGESDRFRRWVPLRVAYTISSPSTVSPSFKRWWTSINALRASSDCFPTSSRRHPHR